METLKTNPSTIRESYNSIAEFYPFYLSQHSSRSNRRLHFIGTSIVIALLLVGLLSGNYLLFIAVPLAGYGFAWVGHFFIEKNKPATFKYPWYSLACDFVMFKDILIGRIKF